MEDITIIGGVVSLLITWFIAIIDDNESHLGNIIYSLFLSIMLSIGAFCAGGWIGSQIQGV